MNASLKTTTRWLSVVATVVTFLILLMGATVTNTGSERGCGRSWPLCHGQFVPQFAVKTMIEWSHRVVVPIDSVLTIAVAIASMYLYRRRQVRVLAVSMVFFLFLQAGLGAWAVLYPQMAAALALHFGVSLIAFASVLLVTTMLFEVDNREDLHDRAVSPAFRWFVWLLTVYTMVVVYMGAYVRHTKASLSCHGWPLCNGQLIPVFQGTILSNFAHRFAAGVLGLAIAGLVVWTYRFRRRRPDLYRASLATLGLVILQSISGAAIVWTKLDIFSALAHAALVGLMFGSLSYLCLHVLRRPLPRAERARAAPVAEPRTGRVGTQV